MALDKKVKTKNDLIKEVSRKLEITQEDCRKVLDSILNEIKLELSNQNTILIQNFAKFEIKPDNRKLCNPRTRQPVKSRDTRIAVTISSVLKNEILK
jgi:nucleoid DNA-binding protein